MGESSGVFLAPMFEEVVHAFGHMWLWLWLWLLMNIARVNLLNSDYTPGHTSLYDPARLIRRPPDNAQL